VTPFAVVQRAARLAVSLDEVEPALPGTWSTEMVLRALHHAGLTLDADLAQPSDVKGALERLGVEP
jgi:hypothetical protein